MRPDQLDGQHYDLLDGRAARRGRDGRPRPQSYLAPSHPDLAAAQVELPPRRPRARCSRDILAGTEERYPYVFVDCPPSLGLLTVNALSAANRLIVPVQCEYYALEGLAQLLQSVELVRTRLNPRLGSDRGASDDVRRPDAALQRRCRRGPLDFGGLGVRDRRAAFVRLAEAPSHGVPINGYDNRSAGADAYYRAALEVVERG